MAHQIQTITFRDNNESVVGEDIVHEGGADSGYSSQGSLSYMSPTNTSSLWPSQLQPIYENVQLNSFLSTSQLTPTSQNIRRINDFHITTPNSSLKRSAFHITSSNSPLKRSASSLPCTPMKIGTPKKMRLGRSKASRNMIDQNVENNENYAINVDISPIKSFSPLKLSASSLPCTPMKFGTPNKMRLERLSKVSRNLIDHIRFDENIKNNENHDVVNVEISPIKSMNVLQDRNGKWERKGSFSSTPICDDALIKSMSVSKTEFFNPTKPVTHNSRVIRKTKSFSPSKMKFIVTRGRELGIQAIQAIPITDEGELRCDSERKTIKRKLCRQNAAETLQQQHSHSPKKELDKIIFSKIPCSPQKPRIPVTKCTSVVKTSPIAKRPLFDLSPPLPKPKSYIDRVFFDILSHLAKTTTVIQMILSNLTPKDIHNVFNVSQSWRDIVKNDANAYSRQNKYLSALMKNKENLNRSKPLLTKSPSLNSIPKSPLKRANSLNLRSNSVVVQPAQPNLDDPLLIMKENQRRTKCPRCVRPSIISVKPCNDIINKNRIPFQKSIYCSDVEKLQNIINRNPYEFAECTNKKCRFKFCVNCENEFHECGKCPGKKLIDPMELEDEKELLYPTGSRSKSNLRRLRVFSFDKK